jgi:hypothetical protein
VVEYATKWFSANKMDINLLQGALGNGSVTFFSPVMITF